MGARDQTAASTFQTSEHVTKFQIHVLMFFTSPQRGSSLPPGNKNGAYTHFITLSHFLPGVEKPCLFASMIKSNVFGCSILFTCAHLFFSDVL